MTVSPWRRGASVVAAAALLAVGSMVSPTAPVAQAAPTCGPDTSTLTILNFNDFHGRLANASPSTLGFITEIEKQRAAAGDANSLVLSAGDNTGATLFASFIQDDLPTIDLLNAMELEASAIGNHEFDRVGYLDSTLSTRANYPYLAANILKADGTHAYPPYTIFTKAGVSVAVIGATTQQTPGMVSPDSVK